MDNYTIFYVWKSWKRQAITKFYNKCFENSRSEIVFRTDISWKLTLGAPEDTVNTRRVISILSKNGIQDVCIVYFHTFSRDLQIQSLTKSHRVMFACGRPRIWLVGLSQLCSATFEQLFAFGHTGTSLCGSGNLEQLLLFWAFFGQNVGLNNISNTKS